MRGLILQASIRDAAPNCFLALLVLKIDTIPKPDGLGSLTFAACLEQNSKDLGSRSRKAEDCSIAFEIRICNYLVAKTSWIPSAKDSAATGTNWASRLRLQSVNDPQKLARKINNLGSLLWARQDMTMTDRVSIKSKRASKEVSHRFLFGGLKLFICQVTGT